MTYLLSAIGTPRGNSSDTCSLKFLKTKGSIQHAFTVCIYTENHNQVSFYSFVLDEIFVLVELTLGHLLYHLTNRPPQLPTSQCLQHGSTHLGTLILENEPWNLPRISKKNYESSGISLLHCCSHLFYTCYVFSQSETRQSQAQQGLLSLLILSSPFPCPWFC